MKLLIENKKRVVIEGILLVISLIAFILLYSSLKGGTTNLIGFLINWVKSLDWYWYLGVMIITGIKPVHSLYKLTKKSKTPESVKSKKVKSKPIKKKKSKKK